ncbi:HD-GYP domain-containing protein [Paenibacillus antibioticophila]|nr:HD-GYP domain-containing protein [Paenibacillus antibioticophila]
MRVHIMDIQPGDQLEADVFNHFGVLILQKDQELSSSAIVKLMQHGIDYIDIRPHKVNVEVPKAELLPPQVQKMKALFDGAIDGFESLFEDVITKGTFDNEQVDRTFDPIVNQLAAQKDVVSLLLLLNDNNNNYTYNHSLQVGMLSYYIAIWLGYPQEDAYLAGKAGYLIDIGKCKIPQDILHKPGKLTPEEFEEIKLHTTYGHEIILNSTGDELSALIALQHHEREDGSGYPKGLHGSEIHPFAKIAAVADVYSAMTSNRIYQSKKELLTVLRELNELSFGKLSPEPTQVLINHLIPNFIGKKVLLSSGEIGSIVMTNQSDFFRPLVKADSRFVDLSKMRDIAITEVYM